MSALTIPTEMRAVEISGYGGPDKLRMTRRPVPEPGPTDVLVQVMAAGVNRPDVSQRIGIYDPPPGASDLPGLDIAGVVVTVGNEVRRWKAGDAVCALVTGGGYAQYCVAPEGQCMPLPNGFGFPEAAAIPETFFTAWVNVLEPELGRLAPGEHLLIQGGTSGVGIAAIQLARLLRDARVVVTASTSKKRGLCLSLGAHAAIDYRERDWPGLVNDAVGGAGFDVILDSQAGPYTNPHLKLLRTGGRLVLIATHQGQRVEIDLRDLNRRRLTLTGSTLRARPVAFKSRIAREMERQVWPHLATGRVRVVIDRVLPLEEAAAAHALLDSGDQMGKVILSVSH